MTATATPNNQAVSEWVKIFPRQLTECYTSSVTFMKQLTVVAISTITYLKNALPNDSYIVETFAGAKLRILKKKCRDDVAQFLSTALTQAFEAFDKKYLHQLALCFYEDECKIENLVEYHIFEYSYNNDGVTMNVHSKNRDNITHTMKYSFENVRERTINLVRAYVVLMQTCRNELPSSYDVSLRLYYNDDAPADYQAPGYQNTGENDHLMNSLRESIKVGWVETPFHKLASRYYVKEYFGSSHEAIPSQNAPILTNEMDLSGPYTQNISDSGNQVVCPCNKIDFEENGMLTCQYCNTQQHAACFGILRVTRDVQHCCTACYDYDTTRTPTDGRIAALRGRKRECLSIFRRTLHFSSQMPLLCVNDFMQKFNMTKTDASKLMNILYSQRILKINPEIDASPQKVIHEKLKEIEANYFHTKEDNIVDRLLAETFSQDSVNDPISDVLSPFEKVSLNVKDGSTDANGRLKEKAKNLNDEAGNTDTGERDSLNDKGGSIETNMHLKELDSMNGNVGSTDTNIYMKELDSLNDKGGRTEASERLKECDSLNGAGGSTDSNYLALQEYRAALRSDSISAPEKRSVKRKVESKPSLRLGVRTKRARALNDYNY